MSRVNMLKKGNGFFGIGIMNSTEQLNIGTLWRSAYILGASFIFTINRKYKQQGSDVSKVWSKNPLYHYDDFEDFKNNLPYSTRIVAVEMGKQAVPVQDYEHPDRVVYLLGGEVNGLSKTTLDHCHALIKLPGEHSLNVAVAGSLVMYDRMNKIPVG